MPDAIIDTTITNRRPARIECTAADHAKEQRMRRWACKIVSELPADAADGQRVLDLAGELLRGWASKASKNGR